MMRRILGGLVLTLVLFVAACGDTEPMPPATPTPVPTESRTPTITPTPTNTIPGGPCDTRTPAAGSAVCGNGTKEGDEECDDGDLFGGDRCAANCTCERPDKARCELGGNSGSLVQGSLLAVRLMFENSRVLATSGSPREGTVVTTDPEITFAPGDIPQVVKVEDLQIDPLVLPGLLCVCVRGVPIPEEFGEGNALTSIVGCGPGGLADTDIFSEQDHIIEDPSCTTGKPDTMHPGVCNGLPQVTFSGQGPRGSSRISANLSLSILMDGGRCGQGEPPVLPIYGPDNIACTDDDPIQAAPNRLEATTGTAEAAIFDLNNTPGSKMDKNTRCGGNLCVTTISGNLIDCDALEGNSTVVPNGTKWVGASTSLDLQTIGDVVLTSTFECQLPQQ